MEKIKTKQKNKHFFLNQLNFPEIKVLIFILVLLYDATNIVFLFCI